MCATLGQALVLVLNRLWANCDPGISSPKSEETLIAIVQKLLVFIQNFLCFQNHLNVVSWVYIHYV